jgi:NitT/TauT family transport system ATP-binding protein
MGYVDLSALLEVKGLEKTFTSEKRSLKVLADINLQVQQGDFVCIVGPSGCGKSTLLAQLAGFEKRDSGHIYFNGVEVLKPQTNRIMVFQDFNQLFPWKTVLGNVTFPLKLHHIGSSERERKEIAEQYLTLVKLEGFKDYYPHELSGGMKQRVAIARALAMKSEILLMDEPFGSLDAQSRAELQNMLLEIWENTGITILFVTHDIAEAIILSNRIVVMGQAPENIRATLENNLSRPRSSSDMNCGKLYNEIYAMLK